MFVAGLGTGGTLTGVGPRLKRHNPDIKIVAAEPPAGDLVQGLRSLDEGYIPPILDPSVIDRKFIVQSQGRVRDDARALRARRRVRRDLVGRRRARRAPRDRSRRVRRRASCCSPTAGGSTCRPASTPRIRSKWRRISRARSGGESSGAAMEHRVPARSADRDLRLRARRAHRCARGDRRRSRTNRSCTTATPHGRRTARKPIDDDLRVLERDHRLPARAAT